MLAILDTGDRKVEIIAREEMTLAYVASALGYSAYYPLHPARIQKPLRAVRAAGTTRFQRRVCAG